MRTLAEAAKDASTCQACALALGRTQVVYGVGDPNADLMFIGEGPGANEDRQGEPFVGAGGQLLNRMLDLIGLERADIYIGNVVKCRPPGNRDPEPEEIDACTPWLREQVSLVDPKVIMTLGRFATHFILEKKVPITKVRGQRFTAWGGRTVIPTLHPAAILRSGGEKSPSFADFRSDFETVRAILDGKGPATPERVRILPVAPEPPADEQLGLF